MYQVSKWEHRRMAPNRRWRGRGPAWSSRAEQVGGGVSWQQGVTWEKPRGFWWLWCLTAPLGDLCLFSPCRWQERGLSLAMCARCKYPKGFDQQSSKKISDWGEQGTKPGGGAVGELLQKWPWSWARENKKVEPVSNSDWPFFLNLHKRRALWQGSGGGVGQSLE